MDVEVRYYGIHYTLQMTSLKDFKNSHYKTISIFLTSMSTGKLFVIYNKYSRCNQTQ